MRMQTKNNFYKSIDGTSLEVDPRVSFMYEWSHNSAQINWIHDLYTPHTRLGLRRSLKLHADVATVARSIWSQRFFPPDIQREIAHISSEILLTYTNIYNFPTIINHYQLYRPWDIYICHFPTIINHYPPDKPLLLRQVFIRVYNLTNPTIDNARTYHYKTIQKP